MAKKTKEISIEDFLRDNLQSKLQIELGKKPIERIPMPISYATSLNPKMRLRPYQEDAFRYFLAYWEQTEECKLPRTQLLFHMATGSGKTLIMAGLIVYLYEKGYRNFLFFVNSGNVIEKTKDNFFNSASSKYLFGEYIEIGGKRIEIRQVLNFQDSDPEAINFCLQTIQGLHTDLNMPKENGVTYDDFRNIKVAMIADEAHHINTATKRNAGSAIPVDARLFNESDDGASDDWETTVMRIFNSNADNVLLEFTATEDFTNPNIADKYKDKVIFDYSLKKFREEGYSKDISVFQSDLQPIDRSIQAVIMSQFRRKLGNQIRQDIKPVVMFKSKTIKDNRAFYELFIDTIKRLKADDLHRIKGDARDDLLDAFNYFDSQRITFENLLLEIQEDFKEDNLLLVDGSSITAEKQQKLNSLESKYNEFRAVFAVDMLNEGWDVLNLFDIVRLYDTRDARGGMVGKTTNSEAQLIGRGARYFPFTDKTVFKDTTFSNNSLTNQTMDLNITAASVSDEITFSGATECSLPEYETPHVVSEYATKRKFDGDLNNPLRHLETLSYHSPSNPRYIQELNSALAATGIIAEKSIEVEEKLKEEFKKTKFYREGYVFANELEIYRINETITNIGNDILNKIYTVKINTGEMLSNQVFSVASPSETISLKHHNFKLGEFGRHVLRAAVNRFATFAYSSLHEIFPNLESIKQFIESEDYLAAIQVSVYGREDVIENLSQKEKLYIVMEVMKQIEPMLSKGGVSYRGTKSFNAKPVHKVFSDHYYKVPYGKDAKEEGVSMRDTGNTLLRLDLSQAEWYGYDDNFGTSEEKYLIKYIESILPKLREKYTEIYLLRNYKDLKIYAFDDGRATEPDFVLFMRKDGEKAKYDNIQIFIEPKGAHLRKTDEWKTLFQQRIHNEAEILLISANNEYEIWGMPFYTKEYETEFDNVLKESFLK